MATRTSQLILSLVDRVTAPARGVAGAINTLQGRLEKNNQRLQAMQGQLVGAAAAGTALFAALKAPITTAADFETIMFRVEDATKATTAQMKALKTQARDLGRTTAYTAIQAGEAQEMLSKNGIATVDILNGATNASLQLAAATGSDLAGAADIATDVMASFNKRAEELKTVNNGIVGVLKASKFGIDDYRLALGQAGGVAGGLGVDLEDFNAALATTSSLFASGSDAGTSFKTFLLSLPGKSSTALAAIENYNLEFYDAAGNMRLMAEIAEELKTKLVGLSESELSSVLNDIFGTDAMRTAIGLYRAGADGMNEYKKAIAKGNAQESADARMKGLNGTLKELSSILQDLSIAIGNAINPAIKEMADRLKPVIAAIAKFAEANPRLTQTVIALTAGLIGLRVAAIAAQFAFFWMRGAYLSAAIGGLKALVGSMSLVGGALGRISGRANAARLSFSRMDQAAVTARSNAQASKSMIAGMSATALANANASRAMIAGMSTAASVAAGSITAVAWPVIAVGAAIAAAGVLIYKYWEPISEFFTGFASAIGSALSSAATAVGQFGMRVAEALGIEGLVQPALDAVSQFGTMIADAFRAIAGSIGDFFSDLFTQNDYGSAAEAEFRSVGERAGQAFLSVVTFLPRKIAQLFTGLATDILAATGPVDLFKAFTNPVSKILGWFKNLGSKILSAIGSIDVSGLIQWPSMPSWLGGNEAAPAKSSGVDGARAAGGPIVGGKTYLVGEEGPELITPSRSGYVHDADATSGMLGSGTSVGGSTSARPTVNAPISIRMTNSFNLPNGAGVDVRQIAERVAREIRDRTRMEMDGIYADLT